jgi:hypothetical protein
MLPIDSLTPCNTKNDNDRGASAGLVNAEFSSLLSHLPIQLVTLRDIAPIIGVIVLVAIVIAIIFVIYKLVDRWSKQAAREYIREHPEAAPPPQA